jgi:hypothetical protein
LQPQPTGEFDLPQLAFLRQLTQGMRFGDRDRLAARGCFRLVQPEGAHEAPQCLLENNRVISPLILGHGSTLQPEGPMAQPVFCVRAVALPKT